MRRAGRPWLVPLILLLAVSAGTRAEDLSVLGYFLGYIPRISDALQPAVPAGPATPREMALDLLRRYSPTGYYIITQYGECPAKYVYGEKTDFMEFVEGDSPVEIAGSLNEAVHEVCHAYANSVGYWLLDRQGLLGVRQVYTAFYLGEEDTIVVRHTPVFPSREMEAYFPDEERTMRFETYIGSSEANLGTQAHGIYGLLNEYNAYYHGTKTAVDLAVFYMNEAPQTTENWFKFFAGVNGTYYAYLEFRLYILNYLRYARDKYPQTYDQILKNREFVRAFLRIDRNHAELMESYFRLKKEIASHLRGLGYEVKEDDEYLTITKGVRIYKQENELATYRFLESRLERPDLHEILRALAEAGRS